MIWLNQKNRTHTKDSVSVPSLVGLQKFGPKEVLRCQQSMLLFRSTQCLRSNLLQFSSSTALAGLFTEISAPSVLSEAKHKLNILQLRNSMSIERFPRGQNWFESGLFPSN